MDRKRFVAGEDAYYRDLMDQFAPLLTGVIRPFARDGDHTADLLQQVWSNAFRYRHSFLGRGRFESWLCGVARQVCAADHRIRKVDKQGLFDFWIFRRMEVPAPRDPSELDRLEREERDAKFNRALDALPARERQAIILRKLEGRSMDEVASIMGVRKSTVRSLIRHGVDRLRLIMEMGNDALS